MRKNKISDIREEYEMGELLEHTLCQTPTEQFALWFDEVLEHQVMEPNAMVLSTVSREQQVSSRVVLLKGIEPEGFVFYTNYESRKAQELTENPQASLLFFWPELQRQVRIEGRVRKLDSAKSDAYFNARPYGSRLGAWASPQSQEIPDRAFLEQKLTEIQQRFQDEKDLHRPDFWGGFILEPLRVEFWQGRKSRLHDRLVYVQDGAGGWQLKRLAP